MMENINEEKNNNTNNDYKEGKKVNENASLEETNNKNDENKLSLTQSIALAKNPPLITPILKENKEGPSFAEFVEKERQAIIEVYKKTRKRSSILIIVSVIIIVAAVLLISQKGNNIFLIIGYVLAGVYVVFLIVYFALNKNKFPNLEKAYVKKIITAINSHVYDNPEYKDVNYYNNEKDDRTDLSADHIYKDIIDVSSRNVIKGRYHDLSFRVSELAIYNPGEKKRKGLSFLGKSITCTNKLHFDGRIIYSKVNAAKETDAPSDILDLEKIEITNQDAPLYKDKENAQNGITEAVFVYVEPSSKDYEKILGKDFLESISRLTLDKYLMSVNIVIWGGRSVAYLSYDEKVVALPFSDPYEPLSCEKFINDLRIVLDSFALLR